MSSYSVLTSLLTILLFISSRKLGKEKKFLIRATLPALPIRKTGNFFLTFSLLPGKTA